VAQEEVSKKENGKLWLETGVSTEVEEMQYRFTLDKAGGRHHALHGD
jgi:hypothetical protein